MPEMKSMEYMCALYTALRRKCIMAKITTQSVVMLKYTGIMAEITVCVCVCVS